MTLGQRIKKARQIAGLSQQALAQAIGQFGDGRSVSRTAVVQWESDNIKGIEAANLLKAAKALNVTPEWLQFGIGHMRPIPASLQGLLPIESSARSVPVLHDAVVSSNRDSMDFANETNSNIGIDRQLAGVTGCHLFALEIQEDSMSPEFKVGDLVIIDPEITPRPGEIVVARLFDQESIILRKYRSLTKDVAGNETYELVPFNKDWPKITVNAENPAQIIGTLVEHRCKRRIA